MRKCGTLDDQQLMCTICGYNTIWTRSNNCKLPMIMDQFLTDLTFKFPNMVVLPNHPIHTCKVKSKTIWVFLQADTTIRFIWSKKVYLICKTPFWILAAKKCSSQTCTQPFIICKSRMILESKALIILKTPLLNRKLPPFIWQMRKRTKNCKRKHLTLIWKWLRLNFIQLTREQS